MGPVFQDDTVYCEGYLKFLQDHFVTVLHGMGVNLDKSFSEQDGARPHTVSVVLHFLNKLLMIGLSVFDILGDFGLDGLAQYTC